MLSGKLMPKTPRGHKRPADVIANAIHIMRIATGEIDEATTEDGKNAAAVALGRRGGLARAKTAKKAAKARWSNTKRKRQPRKTEDPAKPKP